MITDKEMVKLAKLIALEVKLEDDKYYDTAPFGCFPSMEAGSVIKERKRKKILGEESK